MKQDKMKRWVYRLLFYLVGQFIITAGEVMVVKADIGVTTGTVLPLSLNSLCGLSLGTGSFLMFCFFIVIQLFVFKREFPIRYFLQIFAALFYGVLIDFWNWTFSGFLMPQTYAQRFILLLVGILIESFGTAIYIDTNVVPMPPDGFLFAVRKLFPKLSLGTAKVTVDCFSVAVGVIVCVVGTALQGHLQIIGVREGTILVALCIGKVMGFLHKPLSKPLNKLFYGVSMAEGNSICRSPGNDSY